MADEVEESKSPETETAPLPTEEWKPLFGDAVVDEGLVGDYPRLTIERERILEVVTLAKKVGLNYLDEITAVDLPEENAIRVVYHLSCIPTIRRNLVLFVNVPREEPVVASVTPVYQAADWSEREVYDLFGVTFDDHPDMRRIMMPDDWEGHPLRKDYTFID